ATPAQTAPTATAMAEIATSRYSAVKSPLSLTTRSTPATPFDRASAAPRSGGLPCHRPGIISTGSPGRTGGVQRPEDRTRIKQGTKEEGEGRSRRRNKKKKEQEEEGTRRRRNKKKQKQKKKEQEEEGTRRSKEGADEAAGEGR